MLAAGVTVPAVSRKLEKCEFVWHGFLSPAMGKTDTVWASYSCIINGWHDTMALQLHLQKKERQNVVRWRKMTLLRNWILSSVAIHFWVQRSEKIVILA